MKYDTDNFAVDVIEQSYSIPVLADFWAEWCGPCKILGPILEKLAQRSQGRWALVKVNTEKYPQLASRYGVRSIPNVKLFVDGKVVNEFVGALPEPMIVQWLEKALPSKYHRLLEEAQRLLAAQKASEAQKFLEKVVSAEPDNDQARVLLAQSYVYSDPKKAVALVERIEPGSEYVELAEAIKILGQLFQRLEDADALPEGQVKTLYLNAIRALHAQDFTGALNGFIEAIRKDRSFDNDASRKACIAIFKFLGEDHEITQKYRTVFSSALYA
jgi:putative thioredoxin